MRLLRKGRRVRGEDAYRATFGYSLAAIITKALVASSRTAKSNSDAVTAGSSDHHQRAQRIHLIRQRVGVGNDLQPVGHDGDGVDGVAGEEQRHGQDLADAHEPLARLDDAGDDQRERGEERRAQQDDADDAEQVQRVPAHLDSQQKRQHIDDDRLRQGADARRERFAQHQRGARRRADEELLNDPEVALPDDRDAVEDRDEEHALRQDARRHEVEVAQVAGRDRPDAGEDLPEHQQPQGRLHGARDQLGRVVAQLAHFQFGDDAGLPRETRDRGERVPRGARPRLR